MALRCISVSREETMGPGPGGEYYLGDALALIDELLKKYRGKVKCVYLDPPFLTGQSFEMNVRIGEKDWKTMTGSTRVHTFDDCKDPDHYYTMMSMSFRPWENGFTKGRYLAGIEVSADAEAPEGWAKWVSPAYEYIVAPQDGPDAFPRAIEYISGSGLSLVGAAYDRTVPGKGSFIYLPIKKL